MSAIALRYCAAETIARELGALALGYFNDREKLGITMKGAQDWLTVADGRVEATFRDRIEELFPGDGVMGEEQGGTDSPSLWIIDPIDGTANFAHGDRQWCVSIGFLNRGVPEFGVIYAPALDEMFIARRGMGATLNGRPIKAADTSDMTRATLEIGWSHRRPLEGYIAMGRSAYEAGANVKRGASGALGMAHVAMGRTDGYVEIHINSWDVAAGVVIARESGAYVNDFFNSKDALTKGNPIICAAPGISADVRKLAQIGQSGG